MEKRKHPQPHAIYTGTLRTP